MVRRTKAEAEATRQALLDAAERLFEARGVSRTSLQDIASAAGLTRGAVYWHFRDKADLFDARYQPVPDSQPQQHTTRFVDLAERLFPPVQEAALKLGDKVVYCIAADRNGYIACHNQAYNHPQRPGDVLWNTAHSRAAVA